MIQYSYLAFIGLELFNTVISPLLDWNDSIQLSCLYWTGMIQYSYLAFIGLEWFNTVISL